ncbi:MAG: hypothetical protein AB1489_02325 [Acidobacteriota bacterium]
MKKLLAVFCFTLLVSVIVGCSEQPAPTPQPAPATQPATAPQAEPATTPTETPQPAQTKGAEQQLVGYISDNHCGLKHAKTPDSTCVLKCVESGGEFVLADGETNVTYKIDKDGQAKAKGFAGKKVKVTGEVDQESKTVKVSSIEAAS